MKNDEQGRKRQEKMMKTSKKIKHNEKERKTLKNDEKTGTKTMKNDDQERKKQETLMKKSDKK